MAAAGVRRAGGRFHGRETWIGGGGGAGGYYYFLGGGGGGGDGFSRVLVEASAPAEDAPATAGREPPPAAAAASAVAARITPAVLFVTVVLAVVLLVSGLLHVLRRLFLKTHRASAGGGERQLQLQHLFFPGHEDGAGGSGGGGLAQAAIDALPEFAYAELSGAASSAAAAAASGKGKEKAARPFDCAVCLSEFADHDRLRLLPSCGHAFHVACIDVWLRSSATCPLCRTKLSPRHLAAAATAADAPSIGQDAEEQKDQEAPDEAAASSSVVLPVRLGRFTSADGDGDAEESTSDSSRIDARRCYSMGSYQYVLADEHLLVSVHMRHGGNASGAGTACVAGTTAGAAATSVGGGGVPQQQGKKVFARGDSFSVSKIWQWRGSKRLPVSLCADDSLPWAPAAKDPAGTHTRQQQRSDT